MSRPRRLVACLTASLLLGAPGAALAQSAGDGQYQDPLAGNTTSTQTSTSSSATPPSSNGLGQTPPSSGSASASGSGSGSGSASTTTTPSASTSSSDALPNTGFDARLVAALGGALLLGGAGLRLRARGAGR